jgi:hypothetical protein
MRYSLTLSIFIAATTTCFAAPAVLPTKARTIANSPRLSGDVLRQVVNPRFYKSLLISPIEGWIIVRAQLINTRFVGSKVVQSELNGAYDRLALELADNIAITGNTSVGTHLPNSPVLLHLLIYKIADGKLALSFAHLDEAGGNQGYYYGSAWMAVQKNGKWTKIKGFGDK